MNVRHQLVEEIVAGPVDGQIFIVEGAFGSGKSSLLNALRQHWEPQRECLMILTDQQDHQLPFAAFSHVIGSADTAYADVLAALDAAQNPVIMIDDFELLDLASRRLLFWAQEHRAISIVICCHRSDSHQELVELLSQPNVHHVALPPLTSEQIALVLHQVWGYQPLPWQVVAAARYSDANLLAVETLARFVSQNMPDATGPAVWQEHFLYPFDDIHASLREFLEHLQQAYDPQLMDAAQRMAMIGPCSVSQAVQLVGAMALEQLQNLGFIDNSQQGAQVQLSNSLLDLSLRIDLLDGVKISELSQVIDEHLDYPGYQPPAAHVLWWKHSGISLPEQVLLTAARGALAQGHPHITHLILEQSTTAAASWLRAEGHVLQGNAQQARAEADRALELADPEIPLNATEALVCVATGLWPEQATRCASVPGLELCATVVHLGMLGEYQQVVNLGSQLPPDAERQMRQNVLALTAVAEAMLGDGNAALERFESIGQVRLDASAITQQNVADALRVVLFLTGRWSDLKHRITEGYSLHAVNDRSGFSTELAVLMNQPSGVPLMPIEYGTPSPLGCVQLRELAKIVNDAEKDPATSCARIMELAQSHEKTLPRAVRLIYWAWMARLSYLDSQQVDLTLLGTLREIAAQTSSRLSQVLLLYARSHLETNPQLAHSAVEQAKRAGMLDWFPEAPTAQSGETEILLNQLSKREYQVSELAATGLRSHDIAVELDVSVRTVETHLRNAYRKLAISSRHELSALFSSQAVG